MQAPTWHHLHHASSTRHKACLQMPTPPPEPFANFIPTSLTLTRRSAYITPPTGFVTPRTRTSASKKHAIRTKQKKGQKKPHRQRPHKRAIAERKRQWTSFLVLYNIAETCLEIAIGAKVGGKTDLLYLVIFVIYAKRAYVVVIVKPLIAL